MRRYWCPKRVEAGQRFHGESPDSYSSGGSCSYCGSLDPREFMAIARGIAAGELVPQARDDLVGVNTSRFIGFFYFAHLEDVDKAEFRDLYNERPHRIYTNENDYTTDADDLIGMQVGYPGYFAVLPRFLTITEVAITSDYTSTVVAPIILPDEPAVTARQSWLHRYAGHPRDVAEQAASILGAARLGQRNRRSAL